MSQSIHNKRKHFGRLVSLSVIGLVMIPLTLASAFVSYRYYQNVIAIGNDTMQQASKFRVAAMEQRLREIGFDLYMLSNIDGIANFHTGPGRMPFVEKLLETFKQRNPDVEGVYIHAAEDGIVAAAPSRFMAVNSPKLDAMTQTLMATSATASRPYLNLLSRGQLSNVLELSENNRQLMVMAVPIKTPTDSIIQPFKVSAMLWVVINAESMQAIQEALHDPQDIHLSLWANDNLIFDGGEYTNVASGFHSDISSGVAVDTSPVSVLRLEEYRSPQAFVGDGLNQLWQYGAMLLGLWGLAIGVMRGIERKLQEPIRALLRETEMISAGVFDMPGKGSEFEEFDSVLRHLNSMAATLDIQMRSMELARDQAQLSEQQKSRFFAEVSHEMRGPLNSLKGVLQHLQHDTDLGSRQKDHVSSALLANERLGNILDQSLDFAKLESGGVQLTNMPFIPSECIAETLQTMRANAERKGLAFDVDLQESLHNTWFSDPAKINQVVFNVLANAVKYTDKGSIAVLGEIEDNHHKYLLKLIVRDTGHGVSAEQQPFIFERFWQGEQQENRRGMGTGLGLYIAKQVVDHMRGEILVQSVPSVGTEITLLFPITKVSGRLDINEPVLPK